MGGWDNLMFTLLCPFSLSILATQLLLEIGVYYYQFKII